MQLRIETMKAPPETVIAAGQGGRRYLQDLLLYRELFLFLAWRDLLVRYKQTVVGVAWALVRPVLTMVVLTFVFQKLGRMPSGNVPYPLMVFSGLLPWMFFAGVLGDSGNSVVASGGLITKVYFPRLLIPLGTLVTNTADFLISLVFLGLLMLWYQFFPSPNILFLPLFLLLAAATSLGSGLWVAASMVKYRDFRFIVPFAIQFGLYISPVGFQSNVVPPEYELLYSMNPMVGVIDGFRWCILGGDYALDMRALGVSVAVSSALLLSGIWYFRKTERSFADVI